MRQLLRLLVFCGAACGAAWAGTCGTGYSKYKSVTVDHTKVPSTLANFPVMVYTTDADLKTTGNGGDVTDGSGLDIIICTASDGTGTQIDHELAYYNASTGQIEFYYLVASLSSSSDDVKYMFYGKSGASDTSNKTAVWVDYEAVYHFGDGTTLSLADSSPNANTLTNNNTATAAAGNFNKGAVHFVKASSQYLSVSSPSGFGSNPFADPRIDLITFKFTATSATDEVLYGYGATTDWTYGIGTTWLGSQTRLWWGRFGNRTSNNTWTQDTSWHFHSGEADNSADTSPHQRLDGTYTWDTANGYSQTIESNPSSGGVIRIGSSVAPDKYFGGDMDEFRIYHAGSGTISTASALQQATYNNLNSPGTFYTFGSEQNGPGGGGGATMTRRPPIVQ